MYIQESDFNFFIEFQIPVTNEKFVSMNCYNDWWDVYCMGGEL